MSFNILDNLDKLEIIKIYPTWIQATCPVCTGKLTISRSNKNGAYACWTNSCHKKSGNLIRKKLYNRYNPFNPSEIFQANKPAFRLVTVVKSVPLTKGLVVNDFLTEIKFIRPEINREGNKVTTYFDYLDFKIVRLDYIDVSGNKVKYFYPTYINSEGIEVQELPKTFTTIPIYKVEYIQPSMIFVEGERCAMLGQFLGIACATFPSFLYNEQYLNRCASYLYNSGVKNVIYLRDNDITGLEKAKLISNIFSKNNISNKIVNVADLYNKSDIDKYDLFDLYTDKLIRKSTVVDFIAMCLDI